MICCIADGELNIRLSVACQSPAGWKFCDPTRLVRACGARVPSLVPGIEGVGCDTETVGSVAGPGPGVLAASEGAREIVSVGRTGGGTMDIGRYELEMSVIEGP